MSDFTPGPWDYRPSTHGDFNICEKAGLATAVVMQNGFRPPQETISNAKLIAASPKLLAALEEAPIVSKFNTVEDFIGAFHKWVDLYKLPAISKARGQSCQ